MKVRYGPHITAEEIPVKRTSNDATQHKYSAYEENTANLNDFSKHVVRDGAVWSGLRGKIRGWFGILLFCYFTYGKS